MDAKAQFSSFLPRVQGIGLLTPLLVLAASLLLTSPATGEKYWMLDLAIGDPRSIGGEWFEAGSIIGYDSSLGTENEYLSPYIKLWLIGSTGEHFYTAIQKEPDPFISLPWNSVENNLACDESSPASAQVGYVFIALLALPMITLPFLRQRGRTGRDAIGGSSLASSSS